MGSFALQVPRLPQPLTAGWAGHGWHFQPWQLRPRQRRAPRQDKAPGPLCLCCCRQATFPGDPTCFLLSPISVVVAGRLQPGWDSETSKRGVGVCTLELGGGTGQWPGEGDSGPAKREPFLLASEPNATVCLGRKTCVGRDVAHVWV